MFFVDSFSSADTTYTLKRYKPDDASIAGFSGSSSAKIKVLYQFFKLGGS